MARLFPMRLLAVVVVSLAAGCGAAPDEQQQHAERMATEHAHDAPVANPARHSNIRTPVTR